MKKELENKREVRTLLYELNANSDFRRGAEKYLKEIQGK